MSDEEFSRSLAVATLARSSLSLKLLIEFCLPEGEGAGDCCASAARMAAATAGGTLGPKHDGLAEGGSPELLLLDLVSLASWCEREGELRRRTGVIRLI